MGDLWRRARLVMRAIGSLQARVILTVIYVALVPPFALLVQLQERRRNIALRLRAAPPDPSTLEQARRQA